MDMDVLVVDSILEVFCGDFGYGLTINANEYDPVDIGLQFVQSQHYEEAIGFLQVNLRHHCSRAATSSQLLVLILSKAIISAEPPFRLTWAGLAHCFKTLPRSYGVQSAICYFPTK